MVPESHAFPYCSESHSLASQLSSSICRGTAVTEASESGVMYAERTAPCHQQTLEACKSFRPHMPSMWISQPFLTILSWNIPHEEGLAPVFPSCSVVLKDGFLSSSASPTNCLTTRISSHCKVLHTQDHWKNHEPVRPLICGFSSRRLQLGLRA